MPDPSRDIAIRTLEATPDILRGLIAGAPAALAAPGGSGAWTAGDVVAHLVMTGRRGAIDRIRNIVADDEPLLINRDEEEELAASGLRATPIGVVLQAFIDERSRDAAWLRSLGDVWARTGRHSVAGVVTAGEFLQHAAYHDLLHIAQITALLQAHFEPLRGPMRRF